MPPPVDMTKGRAALRGSLVAEQDPFFIALGGPKAHDSSGRDDKGESGASSEGSCWYRTRFSSPWVGRRPMTPPVEMTKGRAALPATVVAEQDPFFITLGGPLAHDFSGRDDNSIAGSNPVTWLLFDSFTELSSRPELRRSVVEGPAVP